MSFPRYPSYKDSGVEWLGEVPEHWDIDRLKRSTIIAKNGIWGDEPQQDENDIPCVRVADFDRQALRVELTEPTIRNVVEKERVGRVLSRGDLLLEKSGGGEGQPVGCVVLYDDPRPAVCSNFVARVQTAPEMNSSFWRYVHAAAYTVRLNTRSIKQTSGIQNLDASQYLDERAGFPPLPEQTQIAAFLDRETAKIDELVTEQRRLMELLKEKRQAVISHAVTQGLNPDAPMKPSGIEWLGDVPAHWNQTAIKRVFCYTVDNRGRTPPIQDDGIPMLEIKHIVGDGCFPKQDFEKFISQVTHDEFLRCYLQPNDILFGTVGSVGKVSLVPESFKFCIAQNVVGFRVGMNHSYKYFYHLFGSGIFRGCLAKANKANIQDSIKVSDIVQEHLCVPPCAEQLAIASFLDPELAKFDALTAEAQRAIDLLQERRTALISAAVTGQIDVRQLTEEQTA